MDLPTMQTSHVSDQRVQLLVVHSHSKSFQHGDMVKSQVSKKFPVTMDFSYIPPSHIVLTVRADLGDDGDQPGKPGVV